jgi:autotransporter-associated beta strand protein
VPFVRWTGVVNGDWDLGTAPGVNGTQNWRLATTGTPTNFYTGDAVIFDDTATRYDITIPPGDAMRPVSIVVNTAGTYTVQGAGRIDGATPLTKQGAGTLVLANANTYTGGTTVAGGTLLANGQTGTDSEPGR